MKADPDLLKRYLISLLGVRYTYGLNPAGGDDPVGGFDCSGLACEFLRAAGAVPWNFRMSAQMLYLKYSFQPHVADFGDLAFYGKDRNHITHVGICWDSKFMVEAGGGDATTQTPEESARKNAFVRIRPIFYRKDFLCFARPSY